MPPERSFMIEHSTFDMVMLFAREGRFDDIAWLFVREGWELDHAADWVHRIKMGHVSAERLRIEIEMRRCEKIQDWKGYSVAEGDLQYCEDYREEIYHDQIDGPFP